MGLQEAKKYVTELSRKQGKPELWPDFLTGLPDKSASVRKAHKAAGRQTILYIRIADVEPYLVKYGNTHHTDIIQWAAAILKTTAEKYDAFIGYYDTHDFIVVIRNRQADDFMSETSKLFEKKAKSFYNEEDIKRKAVISFEGNGGHVDVGLMRLVFASSREVKADEPEHIIPSLAKSVKAAEKGA